MGILDDLKNQSDNQKAGIAREQQRQADLFEYYKTNIHPKMLQLYTFLKEFTEHLNYIEKTTKALYPINPDGSEQEFDQGDYRVTIDCATEVKNMNLRFYCTLKQPLIFDLENIKRIQTYTDVLHGHRIEFDRFDNKDNNYELVSAKFKVVGPIPVNIIFQADVENSNINMSIHNFEKAGVVKHILKERHITEEFMDGLGKYILRENPTFFKLEIDEEEKEKIRQKIKADLKIRQLELEEAERLLQLEEEAEKKEKEKKSWKNIFKKLD
jgi:hypothetical protein